MGRVRTALISVSDKTGLPEFAGRLKKLGVEILSTGGTARLLRDNGVEVTDVSDYTGFPEILEGRVKTLHPLVHGGLLARRDKEDHVAQMEEHGIRPIDMVVVNLYPFEHTIAQPGTGLMQAIEDIDIGGPSMIRSAAKNYTHVAVVTTPAVYEKVAQELEANDCRLSEETHFSLALSGFRHTAHYDRAIADYFEGIGGAESPFLQMLAIEFKKRQDLRYGENPAQKAAFYVETTQTEPCIGAAEQVGGRELSFNNILDINAALELVKEFEEPAAIVVKHTNPCGAAVSETIEEAYRKAYLGDPVSAFGSVVALNRPLNVGTADAIANFRTETDQRKTPFFVEAIVAPDFEKEALELLGKTRSWAEQTRILKTGPLRPGAVDRAARDMRRVVGGLLLQGRDLLGFEEDSLQVVTKVAPTEQQLRDLRFAWLCCKHVKSNAIVLAKDGMLLGVGAGQMSRVDASIIAVRKAADRAEGAVLASDAFFPFPDAVEYAARAGVKGIVQPGGAKGDRDVIAAADSLRIAMVLTGQRHFRH